MWDANSSTQVQFPESAIMNISKYVMKNTFLKFHVFIIHKLQPSTTNGNLQI